MSEVEGIKIYIKDMIKCAETDVKKSKHDYDFNFAQGKIHALKDVLTLIEFTEACKVRMDERL